MTLTEKDVQDICGEKECATDAIGYDIGKCKQDEDFDESEDDNDDFEECKIKNKIGLKAL